MSQPCQYYHPVVRSQALAYWNHLIRIILQQVSNINILTPHSTEHSPSSEANRFSVSQPCQYYHPVFRSQVLAYCNHLITTILQQVSNINSAAQTFWGLFFKKIEDTWRSKSLFLLIQNNLQWHIYRLLCGRTVSEELPKILLFGPSLTLQRGGI